ncbi:MULTISPECIES: formyltransferase family protein [unclassified Ensifer]|uniref:formyltransferase family protein n=1 Tax=unclassified Ensifer TaxID=2633371 RepID=UPI000812C9AE|nr:MULTISPECIES: formyltransferase family protein [unclassified Ensifer]OCP17364.1 hypothetical protein BC361_07845 [Ensifer sp. LC54]OCP28731.1 hypothetical protein BC363_02515 [Ensifer sp. LC384]
MKIGIIGQKWLAAAVLDQLRDHEIAFAAAPSAGDRFHEAARAAGVPTIEYAGVGLGGALRYRVDLLICAHAFVFVPAEVRAIADYAIGYHPSLLPLHRGRNAVDATMAAGDRIAGGSVYHLTDEMDGGPIAFQDWCFVREGETAADLWRRALAPIGVELLVKAADHLSAYGFIPADQQEQLAAA